MANGLLNVSSSQLLEKEQLTLLRYLDPVSNQICSTAHDVAAIPTEVPRLLSTVYKLTFSNCHDENQVNILPGHRVTFKQSDGRES